MSLQKKTKFDFIRASGGITIRVERGTEAEDAHPSETALDNYEFDFVIDNRLTLEDLAERVSRTIQNIESRYA